MRLSLAFLAPKKRPNGPGRYIKQGKRRINIIYKSDVETAKKDLEIEGKNMFYLRHPYLTLQQSYGHATALGKGKAFIAQKYLETKRLRDDVVIEERFATLRNCDGWD